MGQDFNSNIQQISGINVLTVGWFTLSLICHVQVCACQNKQTEKKLYVEEFLLFFRIFRVCNTFRSLKIPGITVIKCDYCA